MKKKNALTHIDKTGNVSMVDIGDKQITVREATASAFVSLPPHVMKALCVKDDLVTKKGSVTQIARIAGISAAKKTSELIPLCHTLPLDQVKIDIEKLNETTLCVTAYAKTSYKTGVEMESLTAASIAALTIYDMCKALSHDIRIESISLQKKTGGKRSFSRSQSPDA